jgi:hypothetical protein
MPAAGETAAGSGIGLDDQAMRWWNSLLPCDDEACALVSGEAAGQ